MNGIEAALVLTLIIPDTIYSILYTIYHTLSAIYYIVSADVDDSEVAIPAQRARTGDDFELFRIA